MSGSGLALPPGVEPEPRYPEQPHGVDLFAGAGGFSLGFEQAGWHVCSAAESDYHAACTYMTNLGTDETIVHFLPSFEDAGKKTMQLCEKHEGESIPVGELGWRMDGVSYAETHEIVGCEHFYFGDVRHLTGERIYTDLGLERGDLDCVFGGPPCQGFSIAGHRNVVDPRNSLVFEFARIVCEVQPKAFVMENVPGILSMTTPEGIPVLDALSRIMEDGGMGTYDALRTVLAGSEDVRGAVRGQGKNRKPRRGVDPIDEDIDEDVLDEQLALEVAQS
jgi:DNA (cytosine-5)-methyltransferase 1